MSDEDGPFNLGTTVMASICSRCGGQAVWLLDARINEPRLAEHGISPWSSTCAALEPWPTFRWDVNGYYRALGVSPTATTVEIKDAYLALDGQSSPRLTYIVKQLLNPEVRAMYDSCQLGEVFFDQELAALAEKAAVEEAAEALRNGTATEDDLEPIDFDAALNAPAHILDKSPTRVQDVGPTANPWGHYLWRTQHQGHEPLGRWRENLSSVLWERGAAIKLAVGYVGGEDPWAIHRDGDVVVAFIRSGVEPTPALAEAVADSIQRG